MKRKETGFTLIEVLIVVVITSLLVGSLFNLTYNAITEWEYGKAQQELLFQANFAMSQMTTAISKTNRLILPLADNVNTELFSENKRNILAVTMDPTARNGSGVYYVNTDKILSADSDDTQIDEDIPADNNNDTGPGIAGFDDNGDGITDNNFTVDANAKYDNDEDGQRGEDWLDGIDNDNDGSVDEDIPADNDNDGSGANNDSENGDGDDCLDTVVFYVSSDGKNLMMRLPVYYPGGWGGDHVLAEADSVVLTVERLSRLDDGERAAVVKIWMKLEKAGCNPVILEASVRAGGGE